MSAVDEREILRCASAEDWWDWLSEHHGLSSGVRLAIAKKKATRPGVSQAEALEAALCFGWIDGTIGRLDDEFYLQGYSPRRPKSLWSRINRDHALALIDSGRMQPAGLAEVERARADGRWDAAYASARTIEVPADLAAALAAVPEAAAFFERLSGQNRYAILFRTGNAKRPETRARRIAAFVEMLARGETPYPQGTARR